MKFKDLQDRQIFTWWERDQHHTGVKVGERQAFCFDTLAIVSLHYNKDVKEPAPIPEDMTLKFGLTGGAYLCRPENGGRVLAYRILLVGGEYMRDEDLKTKTPQKDGGERENKSEVYIMYVRMQKKLADLEKLMSVVGMMLEEELSEPLSDNDIMLPRTFIKGRVLTE